MSYHSLCATTYDLLLEADALGDTEFFADLIAGDGEPALEIGCGTGRLLVEYVARGMDVEGVDASEEMLDLCRVKAKARGITPVLHHQRMEQLQLPRRFRTIFVPAASCMLLTDTAMVQAALARFHDHLAPGGRLVVPLLLVTHEDVGVDAASEGTWRVRREAMRPDDGATIRCWELATYDLGRQRKRARLRFDVELDGAVVRSEEHEMELRWYTPEQFAEQLRTAGFAEVTVWHGHTTSQAVPGDTSFTMVGMK